MRKAILTTLFLPVIALAQPYSETNLKALTDANDVSYWGGAVKCFCKEPKPRVKLVQKQSI